MTHEQALKTAVEALMAELEPDGRWIGELSSSALAVAVACAALRLRGEAEDAGRVERGLAWLERTQNADGGWGDCPKSPSNPSTTLLAQAALLLAGRRENPRAAAYLRSVLGDDLAAGVRQIYGEDRTFSVPILMVGAMAGLVDWGAVPRLPYPLAALPHGLYRLLRLQVVSYALPALIAVGLAVDRKRGQSRVGRLVERRVLELLERMMPESGGYLEATPLTAFVAAALLFTGGGRPAVVERALRFLRAQQRPDGSWPIDANLSQWVTSCAINALRAAGAEPPDSAIRWTLGNQTKAVHPFTRAAPGGWGWTDLSGSVPDGDDTSAALLALCGCRDAPTEPILLGLRWLLGLQNADGGWPPFCRGWGQLPFDQSCADITAHALRAIRACRERAAQDRALAKRLEKAAARGFRYLERAQRGDGSWVPLWFGSQLTRNNENPVFGTARALTAYGDCRVWDARAERGLAYLLKAQNPDGGWGAAPACPTMVQETSLALTALSCFRGREGVEAAVRRGLACLVGQIERDGLHDAQPIGLYFAKLWYSEKLYPPIWAVEALGRCREF